MELFNRKKDKVVPDQIVLNSSMRYIALVYEDGKPISIFHSLKSREELVGSLALAFQYLVVESINSRAVTGKKEGDETDG